MPSEDRERDWQLGQVHRKVDAMERMRGITRYTDDIKLPGMLHAKILRSPHAHARIDDWRAAEAWIGDRFAAGEPAPLPADASAPT